MQRLIITPSIGGDDRGDGTVVIDKKFADGVELYRQYWPGPITVVMEPQSIPDSRPGMLRTTRDALPFDLKIVSLQSPELAETIRGAAVVLATHDWRQVHLVDVCRAAGVPCVYVTEYTLKTRRQMVAARVPLGPRRLVRYYREGVAERKFRRMIAASAGAQCNGTPTYEAYKDVSPRPLLYFDTRVRADMRATEAQLEARLARLRAGDPLRLAFSGRLDPIKGADHLVPVAAALRKRGVNFEMTIFGAGNLGPSIEEQIAKHDLADRVRLGGYLAFETELVPFVRDNVDLFICCHRQGDPSCTYLETASCGVPIAGYDNEAFAGLLRQAPIGWSSPMNNVDALADRLARLARDRVEIERGARAALAFSGEHTFELTFRRRVDHLLSVAAAAAARAG